MTATGAARLAIQRRYRAKNRDILVARTCVECGDDFPAGNLSHARTVCSPECRRARVNRFHPWKGRVPPQIVAARAALTSRSVSTETRQRMSAASKGHPVSLAQRQSISRALKGHVVNPGSGIGVSGIRLDLGFYCRSRWEANVARILHRLGIPFEYEPIHIRTSVGTYTPDFRVGNKLIEVKGYMTSVSLAKITEARSQGHRVQVIGRQFYERLTKRYASVIPHWEYPSYATRELIHN